MEVLHEGEAERVRLHGIDTPERGQPYGRKAKQFVFDIAAQKIVTVEDKDTDRYGRTVGKVILPEGRNQNRNSLGMAMPGGIGSDDETSNRRVLRGEPVGAV